MSEDETRAFKDEGKLLEQILNKLEVLDLRLQHVESKIEHRGFDTKPIWERALAEITETRAQMNGRMGTSEKKVQAIETKVQSIETKVAAIATKVEVMDAKVAALESQVAGLRSDYASMHHELLDTQHEFKRTLTRLLEALFSFLTDTRDLMRDNDARLKHLESKLA